MGAAASAEFDPVVLPAPSAPSTAAIADAGTATASSSALETARLAVDAIRFGEDDVLRSLVAEQAACLARVRDRRTGATLLHYAAGAGAAAAVVALLRLADTSGSSINVNARDNAGRTPLMYAAGIPGGSDTVLSPLLAAGGVDVGRTDDEGNNALHVAVVANSPVALRLLLRAAPEAAATAKNAAGRTPAAMAAAAGGAVADAFNSMAWMSARRVDSAAVTFTLGVDEMRGSAAAAAAAGGGSGGDTSGGGGTGGSSGSGLWAPGGTSLCATAADAPAAMARAAALEGRGKQEAAIAVLNDVVALAASEGTTSTWAVDALLQRAALLAGLRQGEAAVADYTAALAALADSRWVTALAGRAQATLASVAGGGGDSGGGAATTREEVHRLARAAADVAFARQLAGAMPGPAPPAAAQLDTLRRRVRAALRAADPAPSSTHTGRGDGGEVQDYYSVLMLEPGADDSAIRAAYRGLARQLHPDKFAFAAPAARARVTADFQRITRAAGVLLDPTRKALYDAGLAATRAREHDGDDDDDDEALVALHRTLDGWMP